MKWTIKKEWIQKQYYGRTNDTFACLQYWRQWNKQLYRKEIKICTTGHGPKNIEKMLEAAFNKENDKITFRKMSLYPMANDMYGHIVELLLANNLKCADCGYVLNKDNRNYFRNTNSVNVLCPECKKLNNQINKLKE